MSTKNIIIAGALIAAGFVAWKMYQKSKANAPTQTVINNQAPADSTASIISSGSAAITNIANLFE